MDKPLHAVVGETQQIVSAADLWQAIYEDRSTSLCDHIDSALPAERNIDGRTALMWACHLGRFAWARALIEFSSLSDVDGGGRTALMWAADSGMGLDIGWLAASYESLFAKDSSGDDAATIAARRGDSRCLVWLLMAHRVLDRHRAPPEAYAVAFEAEPFVIARLGGMQARHLKAIQNRIDARQIDSSASWRGTPLHFAAVMGMPKTVERLLREGADPKAFGQHLQTPLISAVMEPNRLLDQKNRLEVVKLLLPVSDPLWQDGSGKTALMHAAQAWDVDMVRLLLPMSDPNATANFPAQTAMDLARSAADGRGRECCAVLRPATRDFARYPQRNNVQGNIFRNAARKGDSPTILAMLGAEEARRKVLDDPRTRCQPGMPLSHQVDQGYRDALMIAAGAGRAGSVEMLIKTSDPFARDERGMSALMHASKWGRVECVRLLLGVSSPDARDCDGSTALMLAARHGSAEVLRLLLPACRIDLANHAGDTVKSLAIGSRSTEAIELVNPIKITKAYRSDGKLLTFSPD